MSESDVVTAEQLEREREREQRLAALAKVTKLFEAWPEIPTTVELLAMAEYVLSGDREPARQNEEDMHRRYREMQAMQGDGQP